ncbi:MAG: glycosyltransferase family 2 protein [Lachnospiraceae bacterium]
MSNATVLYLIIPCYNEEAVLPITSRMFLDKIDCLIAQGVISDKSRIMFVNDGSKDTTWSLIKKLSEEDKHFIGISQSRNRGHQNAVLAGLMEAKKFCDITVSIDCDGQDDLNAIDEMIAAYYDGNDVVYGVRNDRGTDSAFKRITAETFYKLMNWMGVESIYNHADYRLLSKRVLDALEGYKEVNLFLRGLIPLVGFESTIVYYKREKRIAGETHYPLKKMLALAVNGITSLSVKPIRIITCFGFMVSLLSFMAIIWSIICFFMGKTVMGWASTMCVVCFMGGVQLLSLGVIGEYVGKIYMEVKARPRYIISERAGIAEDDE